MKTLLKNGTVVSGDMSVREDVLIDGEKIVKVGQNLEPEDARVVDVSGKLLFPGFIDGHTHFDLEVAGTVTADDFETGTKAAIAGGTTLVIDYASQDKGGHTLKEGLEKWHKKADGKCSCDYSFHMSVVEWNEETEKEIQALVSPTSFNMPRRTTVGIDFNRVNLLLAVLEKKAGMQLGGCDAYVNLAGGMKLGEPAIDLGIICAVVSSYRNLPVHEGTLIFGEVGLTGEVRGVSHVEQRLAEAVKMGFTRCIMPKTNAEVLSNNICKKIQVIGVSNVREVIQVL